MFTIFRDIFIIINQLDFGIEYCFVGTGRNDLIGQYFLVGSPGF